MISNRLMPQGYNTASSFAALSRPTVLNLSVVALRRGRRLLFEDVNLQVQAGHRVGLVGANGSGKSSLFAAILGQLEVDHGEITLASGTRIAHVAQASPSGRQPALEFVMDGDEELRDTQRAIAAAEKQNAGDRLHRLYERMERIDGFSAEARAARLLNGLGFAGADMRRPVGEFSGGWRMRLNLAQALMCRSDLLLLDEPTNHLDLPAILWLESWLKRYTGALLLVSHDRDFLDALCTRIAHIEHQRIRPYAGNYSQFERVRSEQLSLQQSLFKRQQKEIRHLQSYVDRFRYKASKARQAQSRLKMLERMTVIAPAHVDSPFDFRFMEPPRQPRQLTRLESVVAGYDAPVLNDVDLMVSAGDRIGLLGVNGAGKSTLVKAIADGSTVLSGDRTVSKDTRIGYFAQHQMDLLDADQSPLQHLQRLSPDARESDLRRYLGGFGFGGERILDTVALFSGGEKARLALAMMIRRQPNLLLLDEPTNHLDLEMRQALIRALVEFGGAMVLISHDRHLLRTVCDELVVVHDGLVERFDESIDDYPAWLAERQSADGGGRSDESRESAPTNKKRQRQEEAQRRLALKPLTDRVRDIEKALSADRAGLRRVEERLADTGLYSDPDRLAEMEDLSRARAELQSSIDALESQWLEASEALERAAVPAARG
jgi:ATP-binding cassette subfamily F protein 3